MEEPSAGYTVHGVAKSQTRLSDFTFTLSGSQENGEIRDDSWICLEQKATLKYTCENGKQNEWEVKNSVNKYLHLDSQCLSLAYMQVGVLKAVGI